MASVQKGSVYNSSLTQKTLTLLCFCHQLCTFHHMGCRLVGQLVLMQNMSEAVEAMELKNGPLEINY